jgi:hypothetical protein
MRLSYRHVLWRSACGQEAHRIATERIDQFTSPIAIFQNLYASKATLDTMFKIDNMADFVQNTLRLSRFASISFRSRHTGRISFFDIKGV